MPFSACIIVNQWNPHLWAGLNALSECCDELLLGINGNFSPDDYPELSQIKKLTIISLDWEGYGKTKNTLAQKAKNDWILSIDSDEVADEGLVEALSNFRPQGEKEIFGITRINYLGKSAVRYGAWTPHPYKYQRLYHRQFTHWNEFQVHEELIIPVEAILKPLTGHLNHYTVEHYEELKAKYHHYAVLSAQKYFEQKRKHFILKPFLSATFNFLKNFIFRLGFLDGLAGWQLAKATAHYTFQKYHLLNKKYKTG